MILERVGGANNDFPPGQRIITEAPSLKRTLTNGCLELQFR